MQKRCCNCFEIYEEIGRLCPYCGYSVGDKAEEAYFLQPGTQLNRDRYIIGKTVGQGGFGIIYKAWDTNLQRVVAIKEFFPLSMVTRSEGQTEVVVFSSKREKDYEAHLEKFRREAKIMSLFTDSVNCIKTYDVFEENGTAYIVMEYCPSPTLKAYIKERKGELLPENEVIAIISQILSGVMEIHAKGVYHLDIALDNIFIKKSGNEIKITIYDFGAARLVREGRRSFNDAIILKPGFAPPEQYKRNGKIGPWTDIYAVGATLYYLLTGLVPPESTDREHEDILEEPAKINIVSPALNNATLRAMALNPELRYKNAKEFLADIRKEKVRSDEEELEHRKKARKSFITVVAVVTVLAVAALVFLGYSKGKIRKDEITMWIVEDQDVGNEQLRYEAVIDSFREYYPQVDVNLVVVSVRDIDEKFLSADKKDRPDIIETTYSTEIVLEQCESLFKILDKNKEDFVEVVANALDTGSAKQLPVGMYATVRYKQPRMELWQLNKVGMFEFMKEATGYTESDTTLYSMIQKNMAGRYEVEADFRREVYFGEKFSVYSRSINKEMAAKAFLSYMLTDVGQEKMHITNKSDYLPITESMFELYVGEIFGELEFLRDTINGYQVR